MMMTSAQSDIVIRPAVNGDVVELSRLRLEALRNEPSAFSSDYESARNQSPEQWEEWFDARNDGEHTVVFVADRAGELVGMAGVFRERAPKTRHGGFIWGVYVRPEHRGEHAGWRLTEACTQWAREQDMSILNLTVNSANTAAFRLYEASGFRVCGRLPRALRVDGVEYDELMMVRELDRA